VNKPATSQGLPKVVVVLQKDRGIEAHESLRLSTSLTVRLSLSGLLNRMNRCPANVAMTRTVLSPEMIQDHDSVS